MMTTTNRPRRSNRTARAPLAPTPITDAAWATGKKTGSIEDCAACGRFGYARMPALLSFTNGDGETEQWWSHCCRACWERFERRGNLVRGE